MMVLYSDVGDGDTVRIKEDGEVSKDEGQRGGVIHGLRRVMST